MKPNLQPIVILGHVKPPADSWWTAPNLPRALTAYVVREHLPRMSQSKENLLVIGIPRDVVTKQRGPARFAPLSGMQLERTS